MRAAREEQKGGPADVQTSCRQAVVDRGMDDSVAGVPSAGGSRSGLARAVLVVAVASVLAACGGDGQGSAATATGGATSSESPTRTTKAEMGQVILDPVTGELIDNPDEVVFDAPIDRGDDGSSRRSRAGVVADPAFRTMGSWSAAMSWPEIPIHAALTPDGRVMTFGTDANGNQGSQFNYSVWNPATGEHLVLPNTTPTDIFCSAQILLPGNGDLLLAGGDIRGRQVSNGAGGIRVNWGVNDVNRFRYQSNTLVRDTPMRFARWYASVLTLADGRIFTSGGVDGNGRGVANPEIYNPATASWNALSGISFYENYPRTFLAPSGKIVAVLGNAVNLIDVSGNGSMTRAATMPSTTNWKLPAVEYDTGRMLVVRGNGGVSLINANGATPSVSETAGVGTKRDWASLNVLADGQVLMTGGGVDNSGGGNVSLGSSIWNPATGRWTTVAPAAKSREYHSVALLLPDGRVLSAGGGAPGPVIQLNGEVYSPPYLYDSAGNLAARPSIASAPSTLTPGSSRYTFRMASAEAISKVTMVRTGSVTHAFNFDQSFLNVQHSQSGDQISIDVDRQSTVLRAGYYMVFAFNAQGVPSIAHIVRVNERPADPQPPAQTMVLATMDNFRNRGDIRMVGAAAANPDGSLQLVPDRADQLGATWFHAPITLNAQTSFTTQVQFRSARTASSDGMAIVIQGAGTSALGSASAGGGGIGYAGIGRSVAVEIDSYRNTYDPDGNHIAVLTNGDMTARVAHSPSFTLANQQSRTIWVDYDSMAKQLRVFIGASGSDQRPDTPQISHGIDLPATLGTNQMFIGLTSATGGQTNPYRVEKWRLAAGQSPAAGAERLTSGQSLFPGQALVSSTGQHHVQMQPDGNFVLYRRDGNSYRALWASNTWRTGSVRATMQDDGNLVTYRSDSVPLWASNTWRSGAVEAKMQADGNFVMYRADGVPVWASGTNGR